MRSNGEGGLVVHPTSSWPSPAQDYYQGPLDLNRALVAHPASTFVVRVRGTGLVSAGIIDGDELVIDRSLDARPGDIVVIRARDVLRAGRLVLDQGHAALGTDAHTIRLDSECELWGVATVAIHHLRAS